MVVKWALPPVGHQKYNTDGTSRENSGPSSYGFCIRGHRGNLCYAQAGINGPITNIQAGGNNNVKGCQVLGSREACYKDPGNRLTSYA